MCQNDLSVIGKIVNGVTIGIDTLIKSEKCQSYEQLEAELTQLIDYEAKNRTQ